MTFRVHALSADLIDGFAEQSDRELEAVNVRRMIVDACPGYPCRASLEDAKPGEVVYLFNYEHQPSQTPYRASHAIFIRQQAIEARPEPGTLPEMFLRRPISIRGFDADHMMIAADFAEGESVREAIVQLFDKPEIEYIHLHNAKPGCFAARVTRAGQP